MRGLLADNDSEGAFRPLTHIWLSDEWHSVWNALELTIETFESLGLSRNSSDRTVWQRCQEERLILVSGNRNADVPDSLELTIRSFNTDVSLPVCTFADSERVLADRDHCVQAAERLLEILIDIDSYRGVGRLYLP